MHFLILLAKLGDFEVKYVKLQAAFPVCFVLQRFGKKSRNNAIGWKFQDPDRLWNIRNSSNIWQIPAKIHHG